MNERRWTKEQDQFLRDHYAALGAPLCAERLGRVIKSIHHRAKYLGVSRRYRNCRSGKPPEQPIVVIQGEPPLPVVQESGFIRPPTKARLMGGRA